MAEKVLIVTGSLVSPKETSWTAVLRKLVLQGRGSAAPWLDLKVKAAVAEPALLAALERLTLRLRRDPLSAEVERYFCQPLADATELTEVCLATLLEAEGLPYAAATFEQLFARPALRRRLLDDCSCVFVSSTLLHDLSEVEPLVALLKRPGNRVVLGGALAGPLADEGVALPGVDVLAAGYGELLAGPLARWIKSGYRELEPPSTGRLERRGCLAVLRSGVPEGADLDFLPAPDWRLAERLHGRAFPVVSYESVRGCPYRCSFCNYPYLFDDRRFRFKSARKIADDWQAYAEGGAKVISCLDSLFTMPRRRLRELCGLLLERRLGLQWVCYARADDLADDETIALMRRAGCAQVHIGVESGDQALLDNMDKACTVEANAKALRNCRREGVTSVATLIVGFPGETPASLEKTYRLMEAAPPDFYFTAAFSTRVAGVPVLSPESRRRFGLRAMRSLRSMAPYWAHNTMDCAEAAVEARRLNLRIAESGLSLNAAAFYGGILSFRAEQRPALLEFQRRALARRGPRRVLDALNGWIDGRLRADVKRWLASPEQSHGPRETLPDPVAA